MFICVKGKSEAEIQTDTDDFLPPLRRLSPPPPANSHAKTACSDTLTEAGYARCGDENQPTVLSWILLSDLPVLRDGTACHACIQSLKHFVACADLHREKKKRKELAIYATFDYIQKELLYCCQRRKNETVFEFLAVGNKGKTALFYSVKGSVRFSNFKFVTACSELP